MAKVINQKDPAHRRTLNPPSSKKRKRGEEMREDKAEQSYERKVGQFSGEGKPPLTKK